MSDDFPAKIYQFLREHIRTIAQLELLLLVHRSPEKSWTVEEIAKQLYIPSSFAASILESLRKSGLVAMKDDNQQEYRFMPKSAELGQIVDELETLYRERPVATIHAIHSTSMDTLQNFADAFRIRKTKDK